MAAPLDLYPLNTEISFKMQIPAFKKRSLHLNTDTNIYMQAYRYFL